MGEKSRAGVVALVSGGLDSLLLVQRLLRTHRIIAPLYVRCGLVWESVELFWLKRWLAQIRHPRLMGLTVFTIPLASVYQDHWSLTGRGVPSSASTDAAVYLPGRNVLLLSYAAIHAVRQGFSAIALGTLAGNPFGDARPSFFKRFSRCLSQALAHPLQMTTPLRRWTKARLITSAPAQPFHLTFSCLRPHGRRHCGRCNKCAERRRAFHESGVPDPTSYANA